MKIQRLTRAVKAYRSVEPWLFFIRHTEFGLRLDSGDFYVYFAIQDEEESCFDVTYCDDRPIEKVRVEVEGGYRDSPWGGRRVCILKKRGKIMRFKQSGVMVWLRPKDLAVLCDVLEGIAKVGEMLLSDSDWRIAWRYAAPCVVDLRGSKCSIGTMGDWEW